MTLNHGEAVQAGLSAPPVAVVAITLAGVTLQDWTFIVTIAWVVMQMGWFLFDKVVRPALAGRRAAREAANGK
jgi:p-aminobenzoyl-glutamate transporter AbgT